MREGAVRRMIRKSEDLSEEKSVRPAVNAEQLSIARLHGQEGSGEVYSWIKKGIPGSVLYRSGFFLPARQGDIRPSAKNKYPFS